MLSKKGWRWALFALGIPVLLSAVAVTAFSLAGPKRLELNGTAIEDPPSVRDVTLQSTAGQTVKLGRWRGQLGLVFFGYANCPDVCPLTMAKLARLYNELGEPHQLQVFMVTVDPERDTPAQLETYVERFHPAFIGLTGTPTMIADATSRFFAGARKVPDGRLSHSSHVTLFDREGRMRLIYNQDKIGAQLKEDLEKLLAQNSAW